MPISGRRTISICNLLSGYSVRMNIPINHGTVFFLIHLNTTVMEKMNDLRDLLKHEIQDLYSVEEQIIEALPKMIEKANNQTLKKSLSEHLKITQEQKKRLEKIQGMMNEGNTEEAENGGKKKGFLSGLFGGGHDCKGMK